MRQSHLTMTGLLISGTDTDVGKTFVTIALAAYWRNYQLGRNNKQSLLTIFKLMQTGIGDVETYQQIFAKTPEIEVHNPLRFAAPLAPPLAAAKEGKSIDLGQVWQDFNNAVQKSSLVIVEALGGLGSPITDELIVGNIAADWKLPTVLVVPVKLGAIANIVANVTLAHSLKIDLKGIILSCSNEEDSNRIEDLTPTDLIQSLTQVPVLGILPHITDLTNQIELREIVSNWDVELIFPQPTLSL